MYLSVVAVLVAVDVAVPVAAVANVAKKSVNISDSCSKFI